MKRTASSSSSPRRSASRSLNARLIDIALARLRPHPANPNVMDDALLAKLSENIRREQNYPPLIVRPHPDEPGAYQILDGHWRFEVLRRLGFPSARCYVWPCDDATALVLLATLNRLEGQDEPRLRAELLAQLAALASPEELARLLPEDRGDLQRTLDMLALDLDRLLADLTDRSEGTGDSPMAITFAVPREDVDIIEAAIIRRVAKLTGPNRRGRALTGICQHYLEDDDA